MSVTVAEVRSRVATALETAAGWTESGFIGGPQWASTGAAEQAQGGTFAVTCPTTSSYGTADVQVPARSISFAPNRQTVVRIDYRVGIPMGGALTALGDAYDAETDLAAALAFTVVTGGLRLWETSADREAVQDEDGAVVAIRGVLIYTAVHPFIRS
jgi:hypothetical protein